MAAANKDRVVWCGRGWQPVFYGFCPSEDAWIREVKRLGSNEPYPTSDARCTLFVKRNGNSSCIIVTLNPRAVRGRKLVEIVGLIVHEAVHVWQQICGEIGEDKPSAEFEAYSVQAITQELLAAYHKTRKRIR